MEKEIKQNSWITGEANESLIYDDDHPNKWKHYAALAGVEMARHPTEIRHA